MRFIQFIPIVERMPDLKAKDLGLSLSGPPSLKGDNENPALTPWSVAPEDHGRFLDRIFEKWVRTDVGKVFVMNFEWALGAFAGAGPGVCYLKIQNFAFRKQRPASSFRSDSLNSHGILYDAPLLRTAPGPSPSPGFELDPDSGTALFDT